MIRNIICVLLLTGAIFTSCTTAQKASAPQKEISIQLYSIRDTIARSGNNLDAIFKGLAEMGYTFISTGADVVALWKYYKDLVDKVSGRDIAEV